jgi:hypothetical protein
MVVWMERGRNGEAAGVYGKMLYNNFSPGNEFPVITPSTNPSSDFYGDPVLSYNQWTQTFFVSALDNNGGTMLVEFDESGTIFDQVQIIAPPSTSANFFNRLVNWFVSTAQAQAFGTFWPTHVSTAGGAAAFGVQNYNRPVGVSYQSMNALGSQQPYQTPGPPTTPGTAETSAIGRLVARIYTYSLGAAALLALLMMILGGYKVMTAAGNAKQSSDGKAMIMGSVVGLGLLLGSYIILNTINPDLVRFGP